MFLGYTKFCLLWFCQQICKELIENHFGYNPILTLLNTQPQYPTTITNSITNAFFIYTYFCENPSYLSTKILESLKGIKNLLLFNFFRKKNSFQKKEEIKMVEPVFKNISAEDSDNGITEIESLCMQCHENVRPFCFYQ